MATLTVKVCDECGKQGVSMDAWMVLDGIEIRSTKSGKSIMSSHDSVDLCSPGCLMRYLSRSIDPAIMGRLQMGHAEAELHEHKRDGVKAA